MRFFAVRNPALFVLVLALAGCGGSVQLASGTPCTVALSGGLNATLACTNSPAIAYTTSSNQSAFAFNVQGTSTAPAVTVGIGFAGAPHTGTYASTGATSGTGATVQQASGATWAAVAGSPAQGSYTLNLTDLGTGLSNSSGTGYTGVHGSLDATLVPFSGSATGNVTLHATF